MVKGKAQSSKVHKKTSATCIKQPNQLSGAATAKGKAKIVSCNGCGIVIAEDAKALQCDRCQSPDIWRCIDCLNLSADMYDHLISDSSCVLRWFCDSCDEMVMDNTGRMPNIQNSDKIDNLISVIEKLLTQFAEVKGSLEG